mgnify:CR=1 FL=1
MQHGLVKFSVILGLAALLALPSLAISQPQADAAVQQRPGANRARAMAVEIRAAIGAGEITAEQGRARIARLRERMGQAPAAEQRPGANRARAMAVEIRTAIGAGEITAEQGRARITRLRKRMDPRGDAVGANERRSRRSSYRSPSSWASSPRAAARSQRCCRPSWDPSRGRSDGRG